MSTRALPVLFVDDEPGNIELFKSRLEGVFAVRMATGGAWDKIAGPVRQEASDTK